MKRGEVRDVVRPDVALVGARMHGDALTSLFDDGACCIDNARAVAFAGISQQRDLVDVDAENGHVRTRRNAVAGP